MAEGKGQGNIYSKKNKKKYNKVYEKKTRKKKLIRQLLNKGQE